MRTKFYKKTKSIPKRQKRTKAELMLLQSLPLETKILWALDKIQEWYEYHNGKVYVSFSGGKDSTVLLHLVRSLYPDVPAVFSDTGLEWPEIRAFVKTFDNVIWVKPKMMFKDVLDTYGYPVVSKKVAKMLRRLQSPNEKNAASNVCAMTGVQRDGSISKYFKLADKWKFLIKAPFKISEQCCDVMKKYPIHQYERESQRRGYVGTLASDSQLREQSYLNTGCNSFGDNGRSAPLSIWTEQDILNYLLINNITFCEIYGKIIKNRKGLRMSGENRTGCVFCAFGIAREKGENRFQRMYRTHPKLWEYCMFKLGLKQVLNYMNIPTKPTGFF